MIGRVFKTITALGVGQLIHLASQLALPPLLIAGYGLEGYAVWLLLSAATSHLNTLDFGLQTYLVNEVTLLHQRGEKERLHQLQAVGMRLSLGLIMVGMLVATLVFVVPVARWIGAPETAATQWTLFLLAVQVLLSVLFGQFNGLYRVIGKAARGVNWHNRQRAALVIATLACAIFSMPFWVIAIAQLLAVAGSLALVVRAIRKEAPEVFPRLDYWNHREARHLLKQSGFFGLFVFNQILVFQIPVILINRLAGAEAVVVYSISRILFSFVRQAANLLMAALGPELTLLMGHRDTAGLARTYRSTESIVCSVALLGGIALYLASPALLKFWLGRPELFNATSFILIMLASMALLVKDYKLTFQQATNQHVTTAVVSCATYLVMIGAAPEVLGRHALDGFLILWLCAEALQIFFIHRLNVRLLAGEGEIRAATLTKFVLATAAGAIGLWLLEPLIHQGAWGMQSAKALLILAVAVCACAFLFDLPVLARQLRASFISRGARP